MHDHSSCPCVRFADVGRDDVPVAGGKGASLGELLRAGIRVPGRLRGDDGGASASVVAAARARAPGGGPRPRTITPRLAAACAELRAMVESAPLPSEVAEAVVAGYAPAVPRSAAPRTCRWPCAPARPARTAPRPASPGCRTPTCGCAAPTRCCEQVRRCWASLYSVESVTYRLRRGIPEDDLAMAVVVQRMVGSAQLRRDVHPQPAHRRPLGGRHRRELGPRLGGGRRRRHARLVRGQQGHRGDQPGGRWRPRPAGTSPIPGGRGGRERRAGRSCGTSRRSATTRSPSSSRSPGGSRRTTAARRTSSGRCTRRRHRGERRSCCRAGRRRCGRRRTPPRRAEGRRAGGARLRPRAQRAGRQAPVGGLSPVELTPDDVRDVLRAARLQRPGRAAPGAGRPHPDRAPGGRDRLDRRAAGARADPSSRAAPSPPASTEPERAAAPRCAEGMVAVHPPLLGTFYRAPKPGAPPYVEVGDEVGEETVVGIVETMKMMTPVHAGVRGTVRGVPRRQRRVRRHGRGAPAWWARAPDAGEGDRAVRIHRLLDRQPRRDRRPRDPHLRAAGHRVRARGLRRRPGLTAGPAGRPRGAARPGAGVAQSYLDPAAVVRGGAGGRRRRRAPRVRLPVREPRAGPGLRRGRDRLRRARRSSRCRRSATS